jgi:hypothetical protein
MSSAAAESACKISRGADEPATIQRGYSGTPNVQMRSANLPHWSIFALDGLGVQLHPKAPTGIEPV